MFFVAFRMTRRFRLYKITLRFFSSEWCHAHHTAVTNNTIAFTTSSGHRHSILLLESNCENMQRNCSSIAQSNITVVA